MDIRVEVVREPSQELVDAFGRLLPQLSSAAVPLDRAAIDRLVSCDTNTVLLARTPEAIVGTLVLVLLPLPSGRRGRIEDVVVDGAARGRGVAGLLIEEAVRLARKAGARTLDLTSRPDRASANRLYERIGFRTRESTVLRLSE
ncbi:GNAT family N-acetyltransferase [Streptomyces sp. SID4946]|uniref:GNAT family N-acetyltransferase n=1 Tax=Streptomyces sp. LamerLS-31b TaxID=1839765 RepID=UPI00081EA27D|nr:MULTISPECIES: GNAT family N-acetyltransferase [unclassified Streptomyces]MYQ89928.1 GNAT family N-acetyltransferase [Streptomyces sp. SID4946]SCF57262.1 Ribosomal protein S18 acetylase RimI [Streptomyces sp. LamerLS-31b]SCF57556.1 Ribosomal protein S18 acetylase RimI [Streptomyces sp. DconLS]